jgi:hypothetical protein
MKLEQAQSTQFAVCLNNEGYQASLEVGKIYRVIVDEEASTNGLIRVIDESSEDYAFSANRFYSPNSLYFSTSLRVMIPVSGSENNRTKGSGLCTVEASRSQI